MTFLFVLYVASGLLLAGLALPLIARRVPPNTWYGFRLPQTLQDPDVWYAVNAYAGRYLLAAGLALASVATVLHFIPGLSLETYALVCAGVALVGIALALTQSLRYLNRLH